MGTDGHVDVDVNVDVNVNVHVNVHVSRPLRESRGYPSV